MDSQESGSYNIIKETVQQATYKLKNRKSPGPDGIRNEIIKYGDDELIEELTILYNKILKYGRVPAQVGKYNNPYI